MNNTHKRIDALMISCGFRGKRLALPESILSIAEGFILVSQTVRCPRWKEQASVPFVRNTAGMLVGRISDYAIDESALEIMAVEVICGYLPSEYQKRIWVYEYTNRDEAREIVIPVGLGCELL